MTKEQFAQMIDGVEYNHGNCLTQEQKNIARDNGFVVVYGASDDLMEFDGAISDELGVFDGGTAYLNDDGLLSACDCDPEWRECPYYLAALKHAKKITAVWNGKDRKAAWTYGTNIPHATFRVFDDGELWCIGIVFSVEDLK